MPLPFLIPAAIQGASALIGGLIGRGQRKEGKQILAATPYPNMPIPAEIQRQAGEGLPSTQYAKAMQNIQRNQTNAILGAQDRRSALGILGRTQQASNDATLGLDVADAQARQQNEQRLAQYKMRQWDWNVKNKYQRDYSYAQGLLGAGRQNQIGALDKFTTGLGMLGSSYFRGQGAANVLAGNNTGGNRKPLGYGTLPSQVEEY